MIVNTARIKTQIYSIIRSKIAPTINHTIILFGFGLYLKGSGCSYSMYAFANEKMNNPERAKYLKYLSLEILLL